MGYISDVTTGAFPDESEIFHLSKEEQDALKEIEDNEYNRC